MPTRRLPNSQSSVIRTLKTARDAWKQYPDARLIFDSHWAKLDDANAESLLNQFIREVDEVYLAKAAQAPLTDAFSKSMAKLTLYTSHFHQVYDLAVARGEFTAGGRAFYGRPAGATTIPDLSTQAATIEAAEKIESGEPKRAEAEGADHTPMALPSAAQVAGILAEAKDLRSKSQQAQAETDREQNEAAALYPEAQKLAVSICNTVEFQLNERDDLDAPGRRRIARDWGVVYVYEPGETPDADDPNAENATLDSSSAAAGAE